MVPHVKRIYNILGSCETDNGIYLLAISFDYTFKIRYLSVGKCPYNCIPIGLYNIIVTLKNGQLVILDL